MVRALPLGMVMTTEALERQIAFGYTNEDEQIILTPMARDGVEALEYLFGTGPHAGRNLCIMPEVVLLDLKMPRLGGLEVLRRIRADERTRYLPVVVLTSSDEEKDMIDSYHYGVNSYISKPVDFEQFTEAVRQLSLYWMVLNQCPRNPLC